LERQFCEAQSLGFIRLAEEAASGLCAVLGDFWAAGANGGVEEAWGDRASQALFGLPYNMGYDAGID